MAKKDSSEKRSGTPASMKESLKKATTEMLVLFMLRQRPMYTYEMMQMIESASKGIITFNTLYLAIYRLQNNGYIQESEKVVSEDNRTRVYFSITETGNLYFDEIKKEYMLVTSVIEDILSKDGKLLDREDI